MSSAFYSSSIKELVDQTPEAILGHLAKKNPFALDALQRNAWLSQIDFVQTQLGGLAGWIAFEFAIPRMGKRADLVLITSGIVFILEFKVGSQHFDASASDQAVDYALDLKNFHAGSHDRLIVPIVVATMASTPTFDLSWQKRRGSEPDQDQWDRSGQSHWASHRANIDATRTRRRTMVADWLQAHAHHYRGGAGAVPRTSG
jgi:hypothetical protein